MVGGATKADNIDKTKGAAADAKGATSDTLITTKVKADLVTEKGIPGTDIKVETNKGVVSLSSTTAVTESQAAGITKKIKGASSRPAEASGRVTLNPPELGAAATSGQLSTQCTSRVHIGHKEVVITGPGIRVGACSIVEGYSASRCIGVITRPSFSSSGPDWRR